MSEKLYGLNKTTLIDYPGKVAATVFTRGCNLRCPYCHNPDFVTGAEIPDLYNWKQITDYLQKRAHLLGGVCITGGEPLLHDDLPQNIADIHSIGLEVKVDTNGTLPDKLRGLKADYIAMDIKTSLNQYRRLGFSGNASELAGRIQESINLIKESGIAHHFRTTVVPGFVSEDVIKDIIKLIEGETDYVLQGFRPGNTLDPAYSEVLAPEPAYLDNLQAMFESANINCVLRYNN
ncbi:MAG: anaerobic ribonucleoside-triphosphate reductase activating protein [Spirochaetales bacterium]|uniref:Anaerobic ribonucleoside-triphosphate reductase activating protein n=1 Tax=Candidatus Thalassospirochaeta sargassi TaxID=3119039 RepID=A0AAJ1MK61_9SPIO|nr:anaerobic ribonucleoside-triphosphate reductase activating protein [Spirochaetales bacterium]